MSDGPDPAFRRGDILIGRVESLAAGGEGVLKFDGMPVFVHRTAAGDLVEIEIVDVRKRFARGVLKEVKEPGPDRVDPPCKIFKVCGGCQWQHISYEGQLKAKEDIVRQAIRRIGGLDPDIVLPVIGAEESLFYRNKVQFPAANPKGSSRIKAGYYKQDTHELVNVKHCPVQPEPLDRMLAAVKELGEKYGLRAYDEKKHRGFLRHITARYSFHEKKMVVTLVVNTDEDRLKNREHLTGLAAELMVAVPEIAGVCLNLNPHKGNRIMGDITICIAGQSVLTEKLSCRGSAEVLFKLSPSAFFQVHTAQASRLLDVIKEELGRLADKETSGRGILIDAYAGVGTMAVCLAPLFERVIAVEDNSPAVADGKANLELNNAGNVEFIEGKVEKVLAGLAEGGVKPACLLADPPRKGMAPEVIQSLCLLRAPTLIYVSCNPATLARDLKILDANGYKTKQVQPVDMFPQTFHVESVATLELDEEME